jgi:hypothetical protein
MEAKMMEVDLGCDVQQELMMTSELYFERLDIVMVAETVVEAVADEVAVVVVVDSRVALDIQMNVAGADLKSSCCLRSFHSP